MLSHFGVFPCSLSESRAFPARRSPRPIAPTTSIGPTLIVTIEISYRCFPSSNIYFQLSTISGRDWQIQRYTLCTMYIDSILIFILILIIISIAECHMEAGISGWEQAKFNSSAVQLTSQCSYRCTEDLSDRHLRFHHQCHRHHINF